MVPMHAQKRKEALHEPARTPHRTFEMSSTKSWCRPGGVSILIVVPREFV